MNVDRVTQSFSTYIKSNLGRFFLGGGGDTGYIISKCNCKMFRAVISTYVR